ncbi:hypothetical protein SHELI_v1c02120 [Spiroplasma helicoides]|uniref:Rhodanese domain-containing protein n=1 Tax=Spiroplasma helicoides TaxID=216938 RepID=A0A1B3SJR5_9MOLU|nr:rhodanese-like domain-containing protein [Spiroplasma helicoides]AOG60167.1 hypothetical protein SHELI_v1c02120 [Spiroplasma helicoides]
MVDITAEQFKEIEDDPNIIIIDVRTSNEYATLLRVPNSINCEISTFLIKYREIVGDDKDRLIVTVCNAGNRSGEAARFLRDQGYNAKVLLGGAYGYNRKFK